MKEILDEFHVLVNQNLDGIWVEFKKALKTGIDMEHNSTHSSKSSKGAMGHQEICLLMAAAFMLGHTNSNF